MSALKKRNDAPDALNLDPAEGLPALAQNISATTASSEHSEASSALTQNLIERTGAIVAGLLVGQDAFLGIHNPTRDTFSVGWATPGYRSLIGKELSTSQEQLARAFVMRSGSSLTIDSRTLAMSNLLPESASEGTATALPIELGGLGTLLLVVFHGRTPLSGISSKPSAQSASQTLAHTSSQISGLRSLADLISFSAMNSGIGQFVSEQGAVRAPTPRASSRLSAERAELEDLKFFYRRFANAIRQCFWVIDLDSRRVLTVSDNFERVWGASRAILNEGGLTGFMASVFPEDRDRVLAEFHTQLGMELETELRVIAPEGELRWMRLRAFPLHSEQLLDLAGRIVVIADDITERHVQEDALRSQEASMVARARALAVVDLASGVAHEINNPLTVIVGRASEVKRAFEQEPIDRPVVLNAIDRILSTSMRIAEIVKSLKSLARQDRSVILHQTPFEPILREIKDMCGERFKAAGVTLEIDESFARHTAEMNPTLVSQLALNLVINAFDAVQSEKEKWVKVAIQEDAHSYFISVTDSGAGIPIRLRSRIFDPFFTTKGPGKGTGLGLSLSASIAAHHQGSIRIDTLNPNTRFVFQLPRKQPPTKAVQK